jgi:hypothetical protein
LRDNYALLARCVVRVREGAEFDCECGRDGDDECDAAFCGSSDVERCEGCNTARAACSMSPASASSWRRVISASINSNHSLSGP